MDLVMQCRELGITSRIVRCVIDVGIKEVEEMGGESLSEFSQLNQLEESGVEKWLKLVKNKEDEENPILLELLLEVYKKLEKIEKRLFLDDDGMLKLSDVIQTHHIGHGILCFQKELKKGGIYYGRIDLPVFPSKLVPFYMEMLTPNIARIIKMGAAHTKSYDSYVAECERIEIREKKEGKL